jgi:MFS family permease
VLLERKAARIRKETGCPDYQSKLKRQGTPKEVFVAAIIRPARMFVLSPIVTLTCIYIAALYGFLYILFTTYTFVYEELYDFSSRGAGLSFIAGGVGNMMGLAFSGYLSDKIVRRQTNQGKPNRPEDRLNLMLTVPSTLSLPVGIIIYGWTADKHVHWIVPMIGTGIMGFGMIGVLMVIQTYLVDSYTRYAASVTAANTVLRSLLGALLPLCGLQLYDALGIGWGNTLLGLIMLALAPVSWLLYKYGERIRNSPRFQREF